jgi:hypothetical protein
VSARRLAEIDAAPILCVDPLAWARTVFADPALDRRHATTLLGLYRQCDPLFHPDVLLLPLHDLVREWWQAEGPPAVASEAPLRRLKRMTEDEALAAYLSDVAAAMGTVGRCNVALFVDHPSVWLETAGQMLDEVDAEDACVYLAGLLRKLAGTGITGLVIGTGASIDGDAAVAFEPLANVAGHYGWATLFCGADCLLVGDEAWRRLEPVLNEEVVIARVPDDLDADAAIAAVRRFRGN